MYVCMYSMHPVMYVCVKYFFIYLWNQQQTQSHCDSQVSVSEEQHEHPVRMEARNCGEPAEQTSARLHHSKTH